MLGWHRDLGRRCSDPAKSRRRVLECSYRAGLGVMPLRRPIKRDARRSQVALDAESWPIAQHGGEKRGVSDGARDDADRVETIGERFDAGARNRAETWL